MNELMTHRLHRYEAGHRHVYCGPLRMHGLARGQARARFRSTIAGPAWAKAFRGQANWTRSLIAGGIITIIMEAVGAPMPLLFGLMAAASCIFVQCWQFADSKRASGKYMLN
jgi:hypothetical protein